MSNILEEFKQYYFEVKENNKYEKTVSDFYVALQDFQENYSIDKFKALSLYDYVQGNDNKDSLCYKIEFGKYKSAGPGIGGGSAYKFGIYYSKDKNEYHSSEHGHTAELNPEEQFNKIKFDLINVVESVRYANNVIEIYDDYPSLKGMPMFINKIVYLYVPNKILPIAGKTHLKSIANLFEINFDEELSSLKINYLINQYIRNIDGLKEEDSCLLGNAVWDFYMERNPKEKEVKKQRVWMYAPGENASEWENCYNNGIMVLGWSELGDLRQYSSKAEIKEVLTNDRGGSNMNNALANWEFLNKMNIGDIVYAKRGTTTVIGKGIVESEYLYDENKNDYNSYRKIKWIENSEKEIEKNTKLTIKTLTDITKYTEYVKYLESLYTEQIIPSIVNEYDKYDFLEEVLISEEKYDTIVNTLLRKKNIILQGAPGVGKTFCAKKIMYSIMNEKADSRISVVQFHQSYSYEDFVQGYRPNEDGKFELRNGVFFDLVMEAIDEYKTAKANNVEPKKYAIIIDEINRGNLSKVFGELMMLIESDKRSEKWSINLTYSDDEFYIPDNLYIIGTMNTADRSLAMIDYALRRRFAFIELEPAFESEKLKKYLVEKEKIDSNVVNRIIENFKSLNYYIKETLGKDFMIGHSYFINQQLDSEDYENIYNDIIEYEIKPLLEEYYFDDNEKVNECLSRINKL